MYVHLIVDQLIKTWDLHVHKMMNHFASFFGSLKEGNKNLSHVKIANEIEVISSAICNYMKMHMEYGICNL